MDHIDKTTILITGVAGLIGSKFSSHILNNKNVNVVGIDNLSGGFIENIDKRVQFHNIDLLEYEKVEQLFEKYKPQIVYHFAAYAAEGLSPFIRKFNYNNNLLSTTNLVNCSIKHKVNRFVFTSSMASYGEGDGTLPFTEETPQHPIDPYGVAKYACEMDIKIAGTQHNLEWCIIRPHNVYGENQNIWDTYRNVLGIWIYKLIHDQDITIYGDGNQTRAFSYIGDILEPLWKAGVDIRSKNQIINLGGIIPYSLNDVSDILIEIAGKGKKIYLEKRHEVKHSYCTYQKSVDLLDYKMTVDITDGLTRMYEWAKLQPERPRSKWGSYELTEGIYNFWKI